MDTVDIKLTVRMVKGIYTYQKDHMAKSTVFSPWTLPFIGKEDTGISRTKQSGLSME